MPRAVVVIGGGPAGTFAAIAAKKQDPTADVTLLTDEACEPYEKPPLSKAVLLGKVRPADAPIAGPGGIAAHGATLRPGAIVRSIDRASRQVVLQDARVPYDALVLATGSLVREIAILPAGMPGVHYLRSEADAGALLAALKPDRPLLVIGAGLIGLEVAASAVELGVPTTVVEIAPRILARVCNEEIGAIVERAHRQRGVDLRLECGIAAVARAGGRFELTTTRGDRLAADVIVVGTGAKPNDALAREAGLAVDDGVVVDEQCRTSDPAIFAAGDVVRFPGPHGPIRLENWRHAQDQGTVAGRNAAGAEQRYQTIPSFWSEQYDLYIQGLGWPTSAKATVGRPVSAEAIVRRAMTPPSALTFDVRDGRIVAAQGINAQKDLAIVRRLIERGIEVDAATLANPAEPLAALLKR